MDEVIKKGQLAKAASQEILLLTNQQKNSLLQTMSKTLVSKQSEIIKANQIDLAKGKKNGMSQTLLDRLELNKKRVQEMATGLLTLAKLPDPIGKILTTTTRPNGLKIKKISVPMGVIGIIYESRPNVTADAAGLCLKAGSAVILRGGSDAINSNKAIVQVLRQAIKKAGVTPEVIQLIKSTDRQLVKTMLTMNQYLDLLIPRGGAGLIQKVIKGATVPVIETGIGNCHLYIDKEACMQKAPKIAFNAKIQRPSVCNATETLLVHKDIAAKFLPKILPLYKEAGVIMHGCPRTRKYDKTIQPATEKDWQTEYLALEIAIKIVDSLEEAIAHINKYNSKHTDAIVSRSTKAINKFAKKIDTSTIISNASTRFTDGGEFGFGCEIGISTQKLHARGPMGLAEITSYKYIVTGNGQVRT